MPAPVDVPPPAARPGVGRSRVAVALWIVALAAVLALHAANVAGGFRQLGLLDLQIYRMGGHAILHGEPLYAGAYAHDGLSFTYSPIAAVVFTLLDLMGWVMAAVVITVASVAALLRSCWICVGQVTSAAGSRRSWMMAIVVLAELAAWPTRSTIEFGQINILLMWLVLEDVLGLGQRARWSGMLTGFAAAIKLTPAFFVVYFVLTKQRRRASVAAGTFVLATVVGVAVAPAESWRYWTRWAFDASRVGTPGFLGNQSLYGALARLTGSRPNLVLYVSMAVLVSAAVLYAAVRLWRAGEPLAALAAAALGPLLVSPISWTHHWVWLLPALVLVLGDVVPEGADGSGTVRRGPLVLAVAIVVVASVRPMTVLPELPDGGHVYAPVQQVLANGYLWVGAAVLGVMLARALRARPALRLASHPEVGVNA